MEAWSNKRENEMTPNEAKEFLCRYATHMHGTWNCSPEGRAYREQFCAAVNAIPVTTELVHYCGSVTFVKSEKP
jgi:hypothetical protein